MTEEDDDAFVHGLVMRVRAELSGAEPSDLVSARILAAARAHARGRARPWWRHPAIAAAAMLVIVAGAVLWGNKGGEVAEPKRPAETQTTVVAPATTPPAAPVAGTVAPVAPPAKQDKPADVEAETPPPPPPPPARHVEKKPEVAHGSAAAAGATEENATATGLAAPVANDQAAQLTRQARTAAKSGQCDAVKMLGEKVKNLDASYYDYAFASDPDIKRCR